MCIVGGLFFGAVWGTLMRYFPEKGDAYVIPLRTLMLFAGGLLAVIGSEQIGYEGAGPLAVVFAAFIGFVFIHSFIYYIDEATENNNERIVSQDRYLIRKIDYLYKWIDV